MTGWPRQCKIKEWGPATWPDQLRGPRAKRLPVPCPRLWTKSVQLFPDCGPHAGGSCYFLLPAYRIHSVPPTGRWPACYVWQGGETRKAQLGHEGYSGERLQPVFEMAGRRAGGWAGKQHLGHQGPCLTVHAQGVMSNDRTGVTRLLSPASAHRRGMRSCTRCQGAPITHPPTCKSAPAPPPS